jgi:hypothetical protein
MKVIAIYLLVFAFAACEPTEKPRPFPKDKFDAIEKIVGNDNWRVIDKTDTSYIYFSRTGNLNVNVYRYYIIKGDSINSRIDNITNRQDSVIWKWDYEELLLSSINDSSIIWVNAAGGMGKCKLKKIDSLHISFLLPHRELTMKKTLPLATFLVRSHYDYIHGTFLADSPLVQSSQARAK